LKGPPIPNH